MGQTTQWVLCGREIGASRGGTQQGGGDATERLDGFIKQHSLGLVWMDLTGGHQQPYEGLAMAEWWLHGSRARSEQQQRLHLRPAAGNGRNSLLGLWRDLWRRRAGAGGTAQVSLNNTGCQRGNGV